MKFSELNLVRPLLKAVEEQGYTSPSPIQEKAIPPVLEGHDLLGCAQTGTGKTAAFALPILQTLAASRPNHKGVRALILTPTRELALQIDACFGQYGKYLNVSHAVIFGGVNQNPQVAALKRGTDVLTACPGRLNDLISQGFVDLSKLEVFVLDEADRMLDMGFVNDVKKVIRKLPSKRQNLLFSATMPREIEKLAATILTAPVKVKVNPPSSTVDRIDQSIYFVQKSDKKKLLATLLADPSVKSALVFSRTKHGANGIATFLNRQGISAAAIHGNKSQSARVAALDNFKDGSIKALIATDIAARGIDINDLSHVFQLDLPEVAETYVHRIGRTGRAGAEGIAIGFCSPEEMEYLQGVEKLIKKKVPVKKLPAFAAVAVPDPAKSAPARAGRGKPRQEPANRQTERNNSQVQKNTPQAAKKASRHTLQVEETNVQEKMNQTEQGLSASAKRRRRRRRATGKPAQGEERQNTPVKAEQRGQAPAKAKQPARSPRPEKRTNAPRAEGRNTRGEQQAPRQSEKRTPVRDAKKRTPAPRDTNPGLPLISRKAPTQKFSSFEEYMQSRGGPGAPIEDNVE